MREQAIRNGRRVSQPPSSHSPARHSLAPPSALVASRSSRPGPNMACHRPCASQVVFRPRHTTRSPSRKVDRQPRLGDATRKTASNVVDCGSRVARNKLRRNCLLNGHDDLARKKVLLPPATPYAAVSLGTPTEQSDYGSSHENRPRRLHSSSPTPCRSSSATRSNSSMN